MEFIINGKYYLPETGFEHLLGAIILLFHFHIILNRRYQLITACMGYFVKNRLALFLAEIAEGVYRQYQCLHSTVLHLF